MIQNLTLAGAVYMVLAILGIAVGLMQFLRPKRGPPTVPGPSFRLCPCWSRMARRC